MAKVYGQYRKMLLEQRQFQSSANPVDWEENISTLYFRIRFYICLILFVSFILLDYTNIKIMDISSKLVVDAIIEDQQIDLKSMNK